MASTSKKYYGLGSIVRKGLYGTVLAATITFGTKVSAQIIQGSYYIGEGSMGLLNEINQPIIEEPPIPIEGSNPGIDDNSPTTNGGGTSGGNTAYASPAIEENFPSLETFHTSLRYTLIEKTQGKEVYKDNRQDRTFTYNPFAHRISYTDAEITIPYAEGITHVTNEAGELLFSTRKIGDLERRLELKMQETFVAAADAQFASNAVGCAGNWIVQEKRIAYSGIGLMAIPLALLGIRRLRRSRQ